MVREPVMPCCCQDSSTRRGGKEEHFVLTEIGGTTERIGGVRDRCDFCMFRKPAL